MRDELTVMFSSYSKFFKHLFNGYDHSKFGFPKAALFILMVLRYRSDKDGLRMSDLEHRAGLKKSTLSESVDALVREGYVERSRSNEDRRVVRVKLTNKGQKESDKIMRDVKNYVDKKLSVLTTDEKNKLFESFEVIEKIAEKLKGSN